MAWKSKVINLFLIQADYETWKQAFKIWYPSLSYE